MSDNSVDLICTSIPFGNHYEYSANYNDFGHNENDDKFFEQMDYLSPQLLRVLKPGRVFACHIKDRVLFGNATGTGMPTIEPFHADAIKHYMRHGFQYMGMITVVTDVVRENNQTYRLGWTENCKDGTKMGVGCPEYILLFRKLPTDTSKAYADKPVEKDKEKYTRGQWQIDAHAFWRSSGDRLLSKDELKNIDVGKLTKIYRDFSRNNVYNYDEHIKLEIFKKAIIENAMGYDAKDDRLSGNPNEMNIQSMYSDIDLDANGIETLTQSAFEELLWFINSDIYNKGLGDYENEIVDVIFDRDMLINESTVIDNCTKSVGILSDETIVANHPWIDNPQLELERIKKQKEANIEQYQNAFIQGDNKDGDNQNDTGDDE